MPNSLNTTLRLKGTGKWTVFVIYLLTFLTIVWDSHLLQPFFTKPFVARDNIFPQLPNWQSLISNLIESDTNRNYTQGWLTGVYLESEERLRFKVVSLFEGNCSYVY